MEINIIYLRLLSSSLLTASGLNFKFLLLSLVWSEIDLMNLIPAYCKYTVPSCDSAQYSSTGLNAHCNVPFLQTNLRFEFKRGKNWVQTSHACSVLTILMWWLLWYINSTIRTDRLSFLLTLSIQRRGERDWLL